MSKRHASQKDSSSILDQAIKDHQQGQITAALAGYERVLQSNPDDPLALRLGGIAARELGDTGRGLDLLSKAAALPAPNPEAFCELALSQMVAGNLIEATRIFRATLEQFPTFPKALANFGALLQYRGHVAEAAQIYEAYLDLDPQDLEIRCNLSKSLIDLGQTERAIQEAEETCRHSGDHPRALSHLGSVFLDVGDMDQAETYLVRASESEMADELTFVNLGSLFLSKGHADHACRALERAMHLNPNHAQGTADYIIALSATGNHAKAAKTSEDFLRRHPGERSVLASYAYALGMGDKTERALTLLNYETLLHQVDLSVGMPNARISSFVCGHHSLNENPVSKATLGGSQTGEFDFDEDPNIHVLSAAIVDSVHDQIAQLIMSDSDDISLMRSPPRNWTLRLWGTVLEDGGRQTPHIHPLSWMSGVYYAKIPDNIVAHTSKNGWLEFGPPPEKYNMVTPLATRSIEPSEGKLVLFPSYFYHSTKELLSDENRVSLAFDVVPSFEQLAFD